MSIDSKTPSKTLATFALQGCAESSAELVRRIKELDEECCIWQNRYIELVAKIANKGDE